MTFQLKTVLVEDPGPNRKYYFDYEPLTDRRYVPVRGSVAGKEKW